MYINSVAVTELLRYPEIIGISYQIVPYSYVTI